MEVGIIGNYILKYRKAAGLTQEELGKAVGVSTQAVSRWECGGAPDAALLPAIADTLGVTIDALFGRDGGSVQTEEDAINLLARYINDDRIFDGVTDATWIQAFKKLLKSYGILNTPEKPESCETYGMSRDKKQLTVSMLCDNYGVLLCSWAKDMSYISVFPEPEKGYAAYFPDLDRTRELFKVLTRPHVLEMLLELGTEKVQYYFAAEAVAKRLSISCEEAERLMTELKEINILGSSELELENRVVNTYYFMQPAQLIPLLYSARYIMQDPVSYVNMSVREKPFFRKDKKKERE